MSDSRASRPEPTPEQVRASYEIDHSLLRWSLSLSLRERLRAATCTARMLGRFRRARKYSREVPPGLLAGLEELLDCKASAPDERTERTASKLIVVGGPTASPDVRA